MSALNRLARFAGLQIDWEDASGQAQHVSDHNLRRILAALGYPADDDSAIADSLAKCQADAQNCRFLSACRNAPIVLPEGVGMAGPATLHLEDGEARPVEIERSAERLRIPPLSEIGYHRLCGSGFTLRLAIAPERCLGVRDLGTRERIWGPAVQIPALRGDNQQVFGDFGTLADTASRFAREGADLIAISPTHALFPSDPSRYSPYAPSSRLFQNVLFANSGLVDVPPDNGAENTLIDWQTAIPRRMAALRDAYDNRDAVTDAKVHAYAERMGKALENHATYDALYAHFETGAGRGWQDWPAEYHDPDGPAVAEFARDHREEIGFYLFAQWLAAESLNAAQGRAREAGMTIGLIADLAVGMDAGGSHAWSRPEDLLSALSVGAPPDLLGPDGQDWGLTTFSPGALRRTGFEPFIATLRAALNHAGGIRIDHILGLNRLWVIPDGGSATDGAYLCYPLEDMLRLLAIESHRAKAIVIGEDLGTVPEGLRSRLETRHILGMRVLWFERDETGAYIAPQHWQAQAAAMTGTHDLPTIAGWWQGRDLEWSRTLGRLSDPGAYANAQAVREQERADLWNALTGGTAAGPAPDASTPGPVIDAALVHIGRSPCELGIVPLEDIAGLPEQPNIPGTIDEHPNWRRRMPAPVANMLDHRAIADRLAKLDESRS
jgi:4-alpha-glucanotransferase